MFESARQGAVHVVSGDSPLGSDQLGPAQRAFDACLTSCPPRLVLNMEGLPLVDGAGLEFLLDVRDRSTARGGALRLAAPNRLCRDSLAITGLDVEIEVFESVVAAVGSFSQ